MWWGWRSPRVLGRPGFAAPAPGHVGASQRRGVRGGPRRGLLPASLRPGRPPAAEAETAVGLPPGTVGAAIYRQHLLTGCLGRTPPCLHEKAEPGVRRGTADGGPAPSYPGRGMRVGSDARGCQLSGPCSVRPQSGSKPASCARGQGPRAAPLPGAGERRALPIREPRPPDARGNWAGFSRPRGRRGAAPAHVQWDPGPAPAAPSGVTGAAFTVHTPRPASGVHGTSRRARRLASPHGFCGFLGLS